VYVSTDRDLFTFINIFDPKNHRDLVPNRRPLSYATHSSENLTG
jgi:hypothetical protein